MNSGVWSGAYYFGIATVLAVDVAFSGWLVWATVVLVLGGQGWVYWKDMQTIDDFYERADRDAG